jgi:hypothetical protein
VFELVVGGDTEPVAPTNPAAGRARNRRVEITLRVMADGGSRGAGKLSALQRRPHFWTQRKQVGLHGRHGGHFPPPAS